MKRSRMNILIVLAAVLFYVFCSYGIHTAVSAYAANDYNSQVISIRDSWVNRFYNGVNGGYSLAKIIRYLNGAPCAYPTSFYLLDEERNIVAKRESYLHIHHNYAQSQFGGMLIQEEDGYTEIIPVGEYLDEAFRSFVADKKIQYGFSNLNEVQSIDYNMEDGKFVPVAIEIRGDLEYEQEAIGFQLSEKQAEFHISESEQIHCITLHLGPEDYDYNLRGVSGPAEVSQMFRRFEKSIQEDLGEALMGTGDSVSYRWDEDKYSISYGEIEGKTYGFVLCITQNETYTILHTYGLKGLLIFEAIAFGIVLQFILRIANRVYTKNQKLEQARKAFTTAVAHELKTPLAIIQSQSECIIEEVAPEKNPEYAASIHAEARRMNALVMRFLQYSRLNAMEKIECKEENLAEIVKNECAKYVPQMEERGLEVVTKIENNILVNCNAELLALAVDNLLSNAMKYAGRKDDRQPKVKICLQKKGKTGFRFSVYNNVKERITDTDEIWNLMSRADSSRNRESNSTGMGLPVTAEILRLHHMKYECRTVNTEIVFEISAN